MKKVLSIVLSIVMVLCMMPAMAFAGTADFTDAADINHDAAVDTLVALGVFEGYPDGSFQPAKVVTRAEMAKIIATVLNGGEAPVLSASTTSYTDTKGHWAAPYIEYCTSLGIVEGVGAGAFSPDAPVTAEAAAKMMLVAQGYNAAVEGMTGAQWASNTNVLANANGYYAELKDIATDAGAAREHIAQMIYNALAAKVIVKSNSVNKETGVVTTIYSEGTQSVLAKYFDLGTDVEGTITKITYNTKTGKYTYFFGDNGDNQEARNGQNVSSVTTAADYTALFQMKVKVLVDTEGTVYGMFADESKVVFEGLAGDYATSASEGKIKLAGVEYKAEAAAIETVYPEYVGNAVAITDIDKYEAIKAIDNNDDGKIDHFTYAPVRVERVTFVGVTSFSTTGVTGDAFTGKAFTAEDIVVYDGMAKDDYVLIVDDLELQKTVIRKLEAVDNGKVTSKTGTTSAVIGGETYKLVSDVTVGSTYDAAIVNGYLALVSDPIGASFNTNDYAVVIAKNLEKTTTHDGVVKTTKVLTAAGETKVIELDQAKISTVDDETNACIKTEYDGIVKLSETEGKYEVKALMDATNVDTTPYNDKLAFVEKDDDAAAHITYNTTTKYAIDADAVVFVANVDAKNNVTYTTITGAELAAKTDAVVKEVLVKVNPSTGYASVVMALVESVEATTAHYTVVYGDTVKTEVSAGKYVYEYNLSTGKFKSPETTSAATSVTKGQFVSYDINSKGEIVNVVVIPEETAGGLYEEAIVKYDGAKVAFATDSTQDYNITKDTVIMYVDSADSNKVIEGATVKLAEKIGANYTGNVLVKLNGTDVELLVVDVKNNMQ